MKIRLNEDEQIVKLIKQGLSERNGHCPCVREISDDTKCMCKQFREQIADPDFEGYCHCMLYYKENRAEKYNAAPSFSFLFGRKEKQKKAKRKEKPDDICKFKGCGKVVFSHFSDSILGKPLQICRAMYYA